jgi:hypothetical protein
MMPHAPTPLPDPRASLCGGLLGVALALPLWGLITGLMYWLLS